MRNTKIRTARGTQRRAGHMEPTITEGTFVSVDGPMGVNSFPAEYADLAEVEELRKEIEENGEADLEGTSLEDYTENKVARSIEVKEGFGAQLSAPGYLDQTDLVIFDTEQEAKDYLLDQYPEDFGVGQAVLTLAEELGIDTGDLEDYQIEEEMGDELFRLVAFEEASDDVVENWLRTYLKQPAAEDSPRTSSARRQRRAEVDLSNWNISALIEGCKGALGEILANPDNFLGLGADEFYEYYIEDISPGSAGTYQPEEIASFFNLEDEDWGEDYEWFWDEIDGHTEPIAAALNEELTKAGVPGHIYFGHLEGDGSYGIFYAVGVDEVEALQEEEQALEEQPDLVLPSTDPRQTSLPHISSARRHRRSDFNADTESWFDAMAENPPTNRSTLLRIIKLAPRMGTLLKLRDAVVAMDANQPGRDALLRQVNKILHAENLDREDTYDKDFRFKETRPGRNTSSQIGELFSMIRQALTYNDDSGLRSHSKAVGRLTGYGKSPRTSSTRRHRRAALAFNSYDEAWAVAKPLLEAKMSAVVAALQPLAAELEHEGYNAKVVSYPVDTSDDYMLLCALEITDHGRISELSVDVDIALVDAASYEGLDPSDPEWGVNISIDITSANGDGIGGYTPENYTEAVWTRDPDQLEERIASIDPDEVASTITDWYNERL